jgi:hypothetical protein
LRKRVVHADVLISNFSSGVPGAETDIGQLVGSLRAEVNNGGFDQFFFNSASDRTAEIISALELIGASKTADIVRRAAGKFPGGMPPSEWAERQDLLVDEVSPEADAFKEFDQEFYASSENLTELVQKYAFD